MTDFKEVLHYIREEADLADLKLIVRECASRNQVLNAVRASEMRTSLQIGDSVMVTEGIKPKYFIGKVGKIVELMPDRARIDFGQKPSPRYSQVVAIPYSTLKALQ